MSCSGQSSENPHKAVAEQLGCRRDRQNTHHETEIWVGQKKQLRKSKSIIKKTNQTNENYPDCSRTHSFYRQHQRALPSFQSAPAALSPALPAYPSMGCGGFPVRPWHWYCCLLTRLQSTHTAHSGSTQANSLQKVR